MKKKGWIAAAVLLVVALGMFLLWRTLTPAGTEKSLTVEVVHGDGSTRTFEMTTEAEYLGPALVENEVVVDNQSAYGLYIQTADGETADEAAQEWWKITKDGERVDTGADSTPIAPGDHFELTLTVGYDGV